MKIAPYLCGQDPRDITPARFFGLLARIPKLQQWMSGKPPSPQERLEERMTAIEEL